MFTILIKRYLFLFCFFIYIFSVKSQGLVSIVNQTVLVSPSNTLTNGTSISVSGKVKNVSNGTIADFIHVNLGIDTSSTNIPKYYWRSTTSSYQSSLLPDSLVNFTVNDIADVTNNYKGGGGGTIIIIWATVGASTNSITTLDSAKTKIFLMNVPTTGVNELDDFEKHPVYLNNPATDILQLNYDEAIYTKVELLNENNQLKQTIISVNKEIELSSIKPGLYFLRFFTKNGYCITKKIIIQ